ncbi:hypothetical protein CROQUDRAFT_713693 [Cronartium quercuum f. sp. fusiforme G11]|uniref:Uncharacterized protein n=1 Tax=Cronartium quercuum f. sp. fusiforme G11 TaxID=708437 RepID=A0A9P6NV37_9BASI|nr:hypothetical protein CROQUDRAFT_713693 [Cronartium quercuum f. sp. fusiforme G11]
MVLALRPGRSLGQFELGTLLWNVLTLLRSSQNAFPNVKVCWDAQESATGYILLSIASPPIQLLFDGRTQRLMLIEAYHPTTTNGSSRSRSPSIGEWISYRNQLISLAVGPNDLGITLRVIHRLFGPTYPPSPHVAHADETVISYPGVAFSFHNQLLNRVILSVQPNEEDGGEADCNELSEAYYKPKMPVFLDSIDGDVACAVIRLGNRSQSERTMVCFSFHFFSQANPIPDVNIVIGHTTSEDIMCDFGTPLRTFWKEDVGLTFHDDSTDRMKIHAHLRSPGRTNGIADEPNPYFMSYFNFGVDFLIDPILNVVIKVVLHSNIPGEVLFARYSRCPWSIHRREESNTVSSLDKCSSVTRWLKGEGPTPTGSFTPLLPDSGDPQTDPPPHVKQRKKGARPSLIPSEFKSPIALSHVEPAMVLDRTADVIDEGLTLQKPTRLLGFDGAVLEVTENDDVETLWVF